VILAIDSGNTRIKWGMHDATGWLLRGMATLKDIATLKYELERAGILPSQIVIANVAGEEAEKLINEVIAPLGGSQLRIKPKENAYGVSCRYDVNQLGVDRWVSLIAARQIHRGNCLVIGAGTALTVDMLTSAGDFAGGVIVPGLRLMKDALQLQTSGVKQLDGEVVPFPVCTADAVTSGTLKAAMGAIIGMVEESEKNGWTIDLCIMSGGDAPLLASYLNVRHRVVENLVLDGLVHIAKGE
jgi:type III pantothenate kinase